MLKMMQVTLQTFQQAIKTGFVTFWLCWLIGTTQVLPLLSFHQAFGHEHTPDTPFHTHAITILFAFAVVAIIATGIPLALTYYCEEPNYISPYTLRNTSSAFHSRAPPA